MQKKSDLARESESSIETSQWSDPHPADRWREVTQETELGDIYGVKVSK
jgi:hypothetical protein